MGIMNAGPKSFPFNNIGDTCVGVIIAEPEERAQTDEKGQPKRFDSGDIKMMYTVKLATDYRDPANPYDDGVRAIHLKWHSLNAVRDAVMASGAPDLEVGGILTLQYSADGDKPAGASRLYNPPKLYRAHYVPAPPQASGFMQEPAPVQPQHVAQQPAPQQIPQPALAAPAVSDAQRKSVLERLRNQGTNPLIGGPSAALPPNPGFEEQPPF
jgi:hypothetical protein